MKALNSVHLVLLALAASAFMGCGNVQNDTPEKQDANTVVPTAVRQDRQDTLMADTVRMDRMDTATDPSMDGKP